MSKNSKTTIRKNDFTPEIETSISDFDSADIKKNAKIFKELKETNKIILEQNQGFSILIDILRNVSKSLDLDKILKKILDKLIGLVEFDAGAIYLVENHKIYLKASKNIDEHLAKDEIEKGAGKHSFITQVAKSKKSLYIRDLKDIKRKGIFSKAGFKTLFLVPLKTDGKIVGVIKLGSKKILDISEGKKKFLETVGREITVAIENAELLEGINRQRGQLESIQNSMRDGLMVFDKNKVILDYNKAAEEMFEIKKDIRGISAEEWVKHSLKYTKYDVKIEGDPFKVFEEVVSKKKISRIRTEVTKKGTPYNIFDLIISPILDSDKNVIGVLANFRDFTKLEKQKREIAEQTEKWLAVFNNVADGIAVLDQNFKFVSVNPALEKLLGIKWKALIGKECGKILDPRFPDGIPVCTECPVKKANFGERIVTYKNILIKSKVGESWVKISASPIRNKFSNEIFGIVLTIRDMSKEKEIEEAKNEFISMASHELRTPLTAMKGFLSMLLKGDFGPLEEKQLYLAEKVARSTERMVNLVEDLLDTSRIESKRIILKTLPIDPTKIIEAVVANLALKASEKQISIMIKNSTDIPLVLVDKERLHQILYNLIDNAIKYSFPLAKVTISFKKEKEILIINIKDTGVGISKEEKEKLFKKFSRIYNPLSIQTGGTGLGLFIVKNLIEAHGGEIWVKSRIGKGTTFSFSLPQAKQLSFIKE
ncbi:MAG: PAS domain S-box protein [Candidatus Aenigmarchaeota archaeon]|nr:PAS domain S-box protein [Candidatus Aenigmarchaeota archaeon]